MKIHERSYNMLNIYCLSSKLHVENSLHLHGSPHVSLTTVSGSLQVSTDRRSNSCLKLKLHAELAARGLIRKNEGENLAKLLFNFHLSFKDNQESRWCIIPAQLLSKESWSIYLIVLPPVSPVFGKWHSASFPLTTRLLSWQAWKNLSFPVSQMSPFIPFGNKPGSL